MTDFAHYDFALTVLILEGVGLIVLIGLIVILGNLWLGPQEPLP